MTTTNGSPAATVVSGRGRFADPWHPFPETSARLAEVAVAAGFEATVEDDVVAALSRPAALLILNLGRPQDADAQQDAAIRRALLAALGAGTGLLAMHAATMTFPAVPEWAGIAGGIWVEGESMHPPYGDAEVHLVDPAHPVTAGLTDFVVQDERYSHLRVSPDVHVLADHEHEGRRHPLVWTPRSGRVVVDALGHDGASYDAEEHRRLLTRAMRWLAGGTG